MRSYQSSPAVRVKEGGKNWWSITCFFIVEDYRQRGLSRALIQAAIDYAISQGARIVEAYPIIPEAMKEPRHELYMGQLTTFEKAGFREVARRSHRRAIVRYHIDPRE